MVTVATNSGFNSCTFIDVSFQALKSSYILHLKPFTRVTTEENQFVHLGMKKK
jgi:hypothetical protein